MFGLGYPEIFVIALVALVVIGPRRLPEMMRQAGRLSYQLRRAANEFRRELELAADKEEKPGEDAAAPPRAPKDQAR